MDHLKPLTGNHIYKHSRHHIPGLLRGREVLFGALEEAMNGKQKSNHWIFLPNKHVRVSEKLQRNQYRRVPTSATSERHHITWHHCSSLTIKESVKIHLFPNRTEYILWNTRLRQTRRLNNDTSLIKQSDCMANSCRSLANLPTIPAALAATETAAPATLLYMSTP